MDKGLDIQNLIRSQEDISLLLRFLMTPRQVALFRRNKKRHVSLKHPTIIADSSTDSESEIAKILRPKTQPTEMDRIMTHGILSPKRKP